MFRTFLICAILLAAAGFAALLRFQQSQALAEASTIADNSRLVSGAAVQAALSSMKLVTVEIDTTVQVRRGDDNWRGTVSAEVNVPVRLFYGTDLAGLHSNVNVGPLGPMQGVSVHIPRPKRIATEVFSEQESTAIAAGGLRLRSRAGEYYLGLARRDAATAAREMVLAPDDAREVERRTAAQVESVIRKIVGDRVPVSVRFIDAEPAAIAGETP